MTQPLVADPADLPASADYPVSRMVLRGLFFGVILVVGGSLLAYFGLGVDVQLMKLLHLR